jgi:hypothetical protein
VTVLGPGVIVPVLILPITAALVSRFRAAWTRLS